MKYHGIMDMYYEDYGDVENRVELEKPYAVFCSNYYDGKDFCEYLSSLGLEKVCDLGVGYHVVLVNLERGRFGGVSAAATFGNRGGFSRAEFEQTILQDYLASKTNQL